MEGENEVGTSLLNTVWLPPPIPQWVLDEMKILGKELDPALYPNDNFISNCQIIASHAVSISIHCLIVCCLSDIILVDSMRWN